MIQSDQNIILLDKGPYEADVLGFVNCGHAAEELTCTITGHLREVGWKGIFLVGRRKVGCMRRW
jgi:hypothetical protein